MNNEATKKRGRPRKERDIVVYKEGNRFKVWNVAAGVNENFTPSKMTGNVQVYNGLAFDWVYWGRTMTRKGLYNAARSTPFRKPAGAFDRDVAERLEEAYKANGTLKTFMDMCATLFNGHIPEEYLALSGSYWVLVLTQLFVPEAGAEEASRHKGERADGRCWGSVTVLPTRGTGYNYSEKEWYYLRNGSGRPSICVKIEGDDYASENPKLSEDWPPRVLANAILHSLWANSGIDSCTADVSKPEATPQPAALASEGATTSLQASEPTPPPESHPDAVAEHRDDLVLEPEVLPPFDPDKASKITEAGRKALAEVLEKAKEIITVSEVNTDPLTARTWGEIKATPIWMKGLTSSKELQAPAPLSRILDSVVSHEATKRLTDECRAIADKKERNEYKRDNMHVFYPSAVFAGRAGGSTKENLVGYTGLACLDLDGMKSFEEAQDVRDDVFMQFPEVLFAAVSASGLGVYALVVLDFDNTEAGYKAALSATMEQFEAKGYMPDTGCMDVTRARYMSSDADALQRPDAYVPKAFSASEEGGFILPATMLRSCWTNSGRKKKGAGKVYLEEALRRIETAPEGRKDTTITSVMGSVARLIRNYGMNSEQVYDRVRQVARDCGFDTRKTEDKIRRLGVKNEGGSL